MLCRFAFIAMIICLQLVSADIPDASVAEVVTPFNTDVIPKEVRDALQETELLQNPVDAFVEGVHTSVHAVHRAAKANKQIMSADDAIAALAKRAKHELSSDLDSKKMKPGRAPHLRKSHAQRRADRKIAARSTSQQAKREKSKKHNKSSKRTSRRQRKALQAALLVKRRKVALLNAKAALQRAVKPKGNKSKRNVLHRLLYKRRSKAHSTRRKVHKTKRHAHWATNIEGVPRVKPRSIQSRLQEAKCRSSCLSSSMKEYKRTCKQQCAKADYACNLRCAFPMKKCKCKCSQQHLWTCSGGRCGCWKLQHMDHGEVAQAMMNAENKALSKGFGPHVAKKQAADARRKALAQIQKRAAKQPRHGKVSKRTAISLAETKKWLHTIF